ncbi:hypothetical protein K493DRAFT_320481 [Basidiobolus meristosporus CBS 931.73]|uniref:Secreted protein n=1 Tax=Basidiobolus meristosporus CBS 931.73 TaxID=1314790 RepID=A0A1Y1XA65_9FUNG|nr:hypothetical protein K493DRAFT_320481 [Basidiobolus meristosporus CBS 931.73]|eukprot:ORX82234.1 hypothetical protein K493DRAFT_320481 [Basidiobolus meristosporus CBS 931.73]
MLGYRFFPLQLVFAFLCRLVSLRLGGGECFNNRISYSGFLLGYLTSVTSKEHMARTLAQLINSLKILSQFGSGTVLPFRNSFEYHFSKQALNAFSS